MINNFSGRFLNSIPALNTWIKDSSNSLCNLPSNDILNIGNALSGIFLENKNINLETPQLVVIGSQSSGKSSLLNNIIQMDILPTGSNMVTRTPLNLQLTNSNNDPRVEFGSYKNGIWASEYNISLSEPKPESNEINEIRKQIENYTIKLAGNEKNISNTPIIIKIFYKNIPNLSLIDLPGLTMVACTDKGQPKDIKKLIKNMLVEYIKQNRTLILCVMPARTDLEADPALDLVKEYDKNGNRTIGILTKVDLMNKNTDISRYLLGNISIDLKLKYGYFAIRNRSPQEMKTYDIIEGKNKELEFFNSHPIYSKINKQYFGIDNLSKKLSNILINHIKNSLPCILNDINKLHHSIHTKYIKLGNDIPNSLEGKMSIVHTLLTDYCQEYILSIQNKRTSANIGRKFKDHFIHYRDEIYKINPFTENNYNDKYIENCIKNCEGNHMSILTPPIEVLENCLTDSQKKPFHYFISPSIQCCKNITNELINLIDEILDDDKYSRFPNFNQKIKKIISQNILKENEKYTHQIIIDIIKMEELYIWTDDVQFLNYIEEITSKKKSNFSHPKNIRTLLKCYYDCIKKNITNNIPKIIMMNLVNKTIKNLSTVLFNEIMKNDIEMLIKEKNNISTIRNEYKSQLDKINSAKIYIEKIL